jgi:flagellar biosynthesis regulator FlbT
MRRLGDMKTRGKRALRLKLRLILRLACNGKVLQQRRSATICVYNKIRLLLLTFH